MASVPSVLRLHAGDTVGVVTASATAGTRCLVNGPDGGGELVLATDVPFGHKVAVLPVAAGEVVVKYGQPIGRASEAIAAGSHVHVHNLRGLRGSEPGSSDA